MEALPPLPAPAGIIDQALDDLGIRTKHSDACLAEAQHWLDNSGLDDPALVDLTHLPFVTIDNPDSRDLDQALVIESNRSGYRIRYALADAAYYIRPGSALFAEALERGSSYYTPLMVVPMLPTVLSEGLVSLNPNCDRRALVFDMQLDADADAVNTAIVRARIHSKAKLDYQGVQNWLNQHNKASKPNSQSRPEPYHESLCLLEQVGNLLVAKGIERGVVNFDRVETRIDICQGSAHFPEYREPHFEATTRERYDTERFNEQISLLCNMQGAELLLAVQGFSDAMQAVYRVHEAPLQKNLKTLRTTLDAIADLQEDSQRWRWGASQNLAEYVQSLPDDPQYRRQVQSIQRQIMQAQRASVFRPEPGEHHALKAAIYARFSAPMREIVGIYTHKELLEALSGTIAAAGAGMNSGGQDSDEQLREVVITSANAARQRQRQLDKAIEFAALFGIFSRDLSVPVAPVHAGTLVGIRQDRLYASLDDMATDIKLYQDDLETQFNTSYRFDDAQAVPDDPAKPSWRLGQGVALSVRHYDKQRRRFAFSVRAL